MESVTTSGWLKIGTVARRLAIAVETIRMYEREGLLLPAKSETGQRLFNEMDTVWIGCIRRLIKKRGLNMEGIRRLLALLPCWNLKPCTEADRNNCPARSDPTRPCWMLKPDTPQIFKQDDCRVCNVYLNATRCENVKNLLYWSEVEM